MSKELMMELHNQHSAAQSKYTYFLLAVSVATLAFAVQRTEGEVFTYALIPAFLAILSWGYSFYCGVKNVIWVNAAISANYAIVELLNGIHDNQPSTEGEFKAAVDETRIAANNSIEKAAKYSTRQLVFIAVGAGLYIVYHLWKILNATQAT